MDDPRLRRYPSLQPDPARYGDQLRDLLSELTAAIDRAERKIVDRPDLVTGQYAASWVPRTIEKVRILADIIERERGDDRSMLALVTEARAIADDAEQRLHAIGTDELSATAHWDRRSLQRALGAALGVAAPERFTPSNLSAFLADLVRQVGGDVERLPTDQQRFGWLLDQAGARLDPLTDWDVLDDGGPGRPSTAGLRKAVRYLGGQSFCFILSLADHEPSAEYADQPGESYGYDSDVSGHRALTDAGRGSRVVFYRTKNSTRDPKLAFFADARVRRIEASGDGRYRAWLSDFRTFDRPVLAREFAIEGWNRQHAIVEITPSTLSELLGQAGLGREDPGAERTHADEPTTDRPLPDVDAPFDHAVAALEVPAVLPSATEPQGLEVPEPVDDGLIVEPMGRRTRAERRADKRAEERAVHIVTRELGRDGWRKAADRQRDGVGYDLEFVNGSRTLHVEVKGIRGTRLRFNVTAREWSRVRSDPDFVVVAVTEVLTTAPRTHLLTRDRLAAADRQLVALRLSIAP